MTPTSYVDRAFQLLPSIQIPIKLTHVRWLNLSFQSIIFFEFDWIIDFMEVDLFGPAVSTTQGHSIASVSGRGCTHLFWSRLGGSQVHSAQGACGALRGGISGFTSKSNCLRHHLLPTNSFPINTPRIGSFRFDEWPCLGQTLGL